MTIVQPFTTLNFASAGQEFYQILSRLDFGPFHSSMKYHQIISSHLKEETHSYP